MELSRITISDINRLKKEKVKIIEMQHAIRINGCVDIWMNGYKLYDKVKDEYLPFRDKDDLIKTALVLANQYGEMDAFKKTKKARMSYKEFKHSKKESTAEYYHWKNNKEKSESSLYFIKCGIYVKIGRSKDVAKRLKQLQTGMPMESRILGSFNYMGHLEKRMHSCFSELKTKKVGEWFYYDKRITEFIKWAKKNTCVDDLVQHKPKEKEIYYLDTLVPFGKYKGSLVSEILEMDKGYVNWLSEKKTFHKEILSRL